VTDWPTVEAGPLVLPATDERTRELWDVLLELSGHRRGQWTLIGGQMVLLHALEHGETPPRVSADLDVLVNARVLSGGTQDFVAELNQIGFELAGASPMGIAHRYTRGGVSVDVLAPEGMGARSDLTTSPPHRTVAVPGGTQALQRTEWVRVNTASKTGVVPRPSLLGAVITKAEAVDVGDVPEAQLQDLAFLLSLIDDPLGLKGELTKEDRRRLRRRDELTDESHGVWDSLPTELAAAARATYRLLAA